MPALQVREMPDELYVRLKNSATLNHRSLSQETICLLESALMHLQKEDSCLETESEKRNARIEQRKKIFNELAEINSHENKLGSQDIKKICKANKKELELRGSFSILQAKEV